LKKVKIAWFRADSSEISIQNVTGPYVFHKGTRNAQNKNAGKTFVTRNTDLCAIGSRRTKWSQNTKQSVAISKYHTSLAETDDCFQNE
jgi:hypothetical protein